VTCLVEDITIKISLNHCEGDSAVLGGAVDLRAFACNMIAQALPHNLKDRVLQYEFKETGIIIKMENTGLYEAAEVGGSDN
jgi:hypothetical protein